MEPQNCTPHKRALELLRAQRLRGLLPHAHLLAGPEGVGRLDIARHIARSVLCVEDGVEPCGECADCRAMSDLSHPDYQEFACPEGARQLPIESIRRLQFEASRKPVMGHRRVFVVRDAERMSLEAANCFLKTLEEPPGECHIVLIADGLRDLPETIISRCQVTKLPSLSQEHVRRKLAEDGVGAGDAAWLAARSWGSPERARRFHRRGLHNFNRTLVGKLIGMKPENNLELSDFVWEEARKSGENAQEQRSALLELIECMATIYRDIAALITDPESEILNEELREELSRFACECRLDAALACADRALEAIERVDGNVNRRIVLDDLFASLTVMQK